MAERDSDPRGSSAAPTEPSAGGDGTTAQHKGDTRRMRRKPALQVGALLLVTLGVAAIVWLANARAYNVLLATISVGLPVMGAVAFVLYRESRSGQAMQRALESMQARASGFFESAMDPIISIDESQRIVLFNPAAEAAFRWPRRAVLGQPLDMLIPERFRALHRADVAQFATTGVTSRRMGGLDPLTGLRANGEEFPIEASISQHVEDGHKLLTVVLRDITTRVRSEALLSRSEARLRSILDSAMDGIITVDGQQKVVLFNAAAEKMFGCPQDQALGAPLSWFIPDRFRSAHAGHVDTFGATGVSSRRMADGGRVVTGLRRSGDEFPIDASISQIVEGDAKFFTVILRDVSERVQALASLARSREELRELASAAISAREQEKSRIARELHDELAQAMSALKMDITLIRASRSDGDGALAKRLDKMEAQIDATIGAMRRIAADLRPPVLDDLGLAPALQSLIDNFRRSSGVRCRFSLEGLDRPIPPTHATAVFRIVQESLTNVAKHAKAPNVDLSVVADDDHVMITVRDDGIGFATDAARKPQSYGLMGVRERAYLLGGEARVTSAPGGGTMIEVRLPWSKSPTTERT